MHNMENDKKLTPQKMIEKSHLENDRMKMHTQKIAETSHTGK